MGFNTVAFVLNDFSHDIEKSPKTAAYYLRNGYNLSYYERHGKRHELESFLAKKYNEPTLHPQALKVFDSFHADGTKYYRAGGNCCVELPVHKIYKNKGKKYIVLEAPEWDK